MTISAGLKKAWKEAKISIKMIAQLLGDTERMVLDVYNHVVMEKEDAAGAVNNAINF